MEKSCGTTAYFPGILLERQSISAGVLKASKSLRLTSTRGSTLFSDSFAYEDNCTSLHEPGHRVRVTRFEHQHCRSLRGMLTINGPSDIDGLHGLASLSVSSNYPNLGHWSSKGFVAYAECKIALAQSCLPTIFRLSTTSSVPSIPVGPSSLRVGPLLSEVTC